MAFVYAYTPDTGEMIERSFKVPLGLGASFSQSVTDGVTTMRLPGADIRMTYRDDPRRKTLEVSLGRGFAIDAALDETAAGFEPMSICTRAGMAGWVYAHKVAAVPTTGTVRCDLGTFDLAEVGAYGHHDFSAGYMRRETFWNWACLSGEVDGRALGLNVSCGVNETSYSENCVWLDGRVLPVGLARFDYDRRDLMRPWHVTTADGAVDLSFQPEGRHLERTNLLLLASNFAQIFGRFDGEVRVGDEVLAVRDRWGFVEEQYAKW